MGAKSLPAILKSIRQTTPQVSLCVTSGVPSVHSK